MSYEISTASSYTDLLDKIDAFLTTNGKAFDPTFTGTGNGKITAWDGTPTSIAETWTITATSATDFTVVGSTSGVKANATVGVAYDNTLIKFTLTAGGTAFVAGDQFKINTCPKWTRMVKETSDTKSAPYAVWKAPGNDGTQAIYMGASCYYNSGSAYYNMQFTWLTGYDSGTHNMASQPGAINNSVRTFPYMALWNASIPYWLCANGQMFRVVAKVSSIYEQGYLGFLKAYASPNVHPIPFFAGGSHTFGESKRYSDTSVQTHAYWRGYNTNDPGSVDRHSGIFRLSSGLAIGCYSYAYNFSATYAGYLGYLLPWACTSTGGQTPMLNQRENLDGSYLLRPIQFVYDPDGNSGQNMAVYGEFDGVYAIPGYAQSSENTIVRGQITHVVFQNVFNTAQDQYCAFALN